MSENVSIIVFAKFFHGGKGNKKKEKRERK